MRLRVLVLSIALALGHTATFADTYPSRVIKIIVPTAAGGTTDLLARILANHIGATSGAQAVVEDHPGAGGNVGMEVVAKSPPDGYTLGFANTGLVINPFIYKKIPFDVGRDLVPVGPVGEAPQLLIVNSEVPVRTLQEFIALAKARPGTFNYGSAGLGSTTHLAADQFARLAGIELVHIPYRGAGPAVTDLVRGGIQMI